MATTYTIISSQTLSGSAASVTFSSIPSTYTDLVLQISARGDNAATSNVFNVYFNNDSGAGTNYSSTYVEGTATTAISGRSSSMPYFDGEYYDAASATASTFGTYELYIPNYLSTSSRPAGAFWATENNSASANAAFVGGTAHLYRGTSAISRIDILVGSGNFVTNSSFYLYGIKNS